MNNYQPFYVRISSDLGTTLYLDEQIYNKNSGLGLLLLQLKKYIIFPKRRSIWTKIFAKEVVGFARTLQR